MLFRSRELLRQAAAGLAVAFLIALAGYIVSSLFLHGHFPRYLWMLLGFAVGIERLARSDTSEAAPVHA